MSKASIHLRLVKRGGWFIVTKICLALLTLAFAASITVTQTTYPAEVGSAVNVTNNLRATDKGFSLAGSDATSSGTSCSSPVTFSATPSIANTNITAGHIIYEVEVSSTATAQQNKTFTVSFVLGSTAYGPLCIQTPAPA